MKMGNRRLVLGTRGSRLALSQAESVRKLLLDAWPDLEVEIRVIKTSGDRLGSRRVHLGRGVFTREIEQALFDREVDVAVHSLKDLPVELPDGLVLAAVPARESVGEALVLPRGGTLDSLPEGAGVGTGSPRRRAFLLAFRGDLKILPLAGNVTTRLEKLDRGEYDAVVLAAAGLRRLGLDDRISQLLEPEIIPPAPGQGALGLEVRGDDSWIRSVVSAVNDRESLAAVTAERSFLAGLGGGCRLPVGAWAKLENGMLVLKGAAADPEGRTVLVEGGTGLPEEAETLGRELAERFLRMGASRLIGEPDS